MSVTLSLKADVPEADGAHIVFRWKTQVSEIGVSSPLDVTNDGRRFVAIAVGPGRPEPSRPITLVTNWDAELRR